MSVNELLTPLPKKWSNIFVNSISTNEIDMNGGPIINVGSINGSTNVANIIYRPGSVNVIGTNIYNSFSDIVSIVNENNINQAINVLIDDSLVSPSPALIDVTLNCQNRVNFMPFVSHNITNTPTHVKIIDGVTLINPNSFNGLMTLELDSITTNSIIINGGNTFRIRDGVFVNNTLTSLVECIRVDNSALINLSNGSTMNMINAGTSIIGVSTGSQCDFTVTTNFSMPGIPVNLITGDVTTNLIIAYDSSLNISTLFLPTFLGSVFTAALDLSISVSYNDTSELPVSGSNNVQGCLDYLKVQAGTKNARNQVPLAFVSPFNIISLTVNGLTGNVYVTCTANFVSNGNPFQCRLVSSFSGAASQIYEISPMVLGQQYCITMQYLFAGDPINTNQYFLQALGLSPFQSFISLNSYAESMGTLYP